MRSHKRGFVGLALLALAAATPPPPEETGDAVPAEPLRKTVLAASYAYLRAKDAGDYAAAYTRIDATMRDYLTPDLYRQQAATFNAGAGKVVARRITRLTWERDPVEAKQPGLYVAADFVSRFANLDLHCGYIMWRQAEDGGFRIVREEQSFVDKDTIRQMPPERRRPLPQQLGCVGGPA